MIVAIISGAIKKIDIPPWNACDWSVEAVIDTHLESPNIEVVKITVQGGITISRFQMAVVLFPEPHAEEIANMAENDKNEI